MNEKPITITHRLHKRSITNKHRLNKNFRYRFGAIIHFTIDDGNDQFVIGKDNHNVKYHRECDDSTTLYDDDRLIDLNKSKSILEELMLYSIEDILIRKSKKVFKQK